MSTNENYSPVRLPKTDYQSFYNNPDEQDAQTLNTFPKLLASRRQVESGMDNKFFLHDGPPYANGYVHMGHALNKVLKDFVSRSHFMMGKGSLFRPGWDCHGLPIEWKVQELYKEQGVMHKDVPVMEFREKCREYASTWVKNQMDGMKRLGVLADWDNPYLTMSHEGDAGTLSVLFELVKKGYVYSASRPVLWSVPEHTVMANAEVEYKNSRFQSLLVKFPVVSYDKNKFATSDNLHTAGVVCWTSTPWSLPGNRAVACKSDENYCVVEVLDVTPDSHVNVGDRMVVAECLVDFVAEKSGVTEYNLVEFFTGDVLEGVVVRHPLYQDHEVKVLCADFVRNDSGTGFVHVAPSLGPDDFVFARKAGLDVDKTLGADGKYEQSVPVYGGLTVLDEDGKWGEGQGKVLSDLKENGNLVAVWNDKHSAAHSWRSGAPLLYRTTTQWFVKAKDSLASDAVESLKDINFVPSESRNRLQAMLETRPDWCVSRQRSWGVPMALFVNRETGELLVDTDVMNRTLALFKEHGSDCWYSMNSSEFLGENYNPDEYEKLMDVLDVWFESGATWSWVMGDNKQADLYLEGSDQHRGWFQSSLLESVALNGHSPYKNLFTHGFVLDGKGRKMSKSLGNVVDPMNVTSKYGADTLRWWVANSDVANDVQYSEKSMSAYVVTVKKLRNTLRWLLGVVSDEPEYNEMSYHDLSKYEQLMLSRLYRVNKQVWKAYSEFDMLSVTKLVRDFCQEDLSALWMNMRKDSVYCDNVNSTNRKGVVYTANKLFRVFASWLSPVLPLLTEQAWSFYPHKNGQEFVALSSSELPEEWNQNNEEEWNNLLKLRSLVMPFTEKLQKEKVVKDLNEMSAYVQSPLHLAEGVDLAVVTGLAHVVFKNGDETMVEVGKADGHKCPRCRRVLPEVTEGGLCFRCENA